MMEHKRPIPSIEWEVTTRCNYDCPYCTQRTYLRLHSAHASRAVADAVAGLLDRSGGSWLIKLTGGEPFVHPRFPEIVRQLAGKGHSICTTSNLSVPMGVLEEFLHSTRGHLAYVTASFHPGQVASVDAFKKKAAFFNTNKDAQTNFTVTAVGAAEQEQELRSMAAWCDDNRIPFEISPYKIRARYISYPEGPFWEFVSSRMLTHAGTLRGASTFGTLCHAGAVFGRITVEGDVVRCYNLQPSFYLGSVLDPGFRWFNGPRPCLAARCTCTVPVERNLVEFGNKISFPRAAASYLGSLVTDTPRAVRFAGRWTGRFVRYAIRHPREILRGS